MGSARLLQAATCVVLIPILSTATECRKKPSLFDPLLRVSHVKMHGLRAEGSIQDGCDLHPKRYSVDPKTLPFQKTGFVQIFRLLLLAAGKGGKVAPKLKMWVSERRRNANRIRKRPAFA